MAQTAHRAGAGPARLINTTLTDCLSAGQGSEPGFPVRCPGAPLGDQLPASDCLLALAIAHGILLDHAALPSDPAPTVDGQAICPIAHESVCLEDDLRARRHNFALLRNLLRGANHNNAVAAIITDLTLAQGSRAQRRHGDAMTATVAVDVQAGALEDGGASDGHAIVTAVANLALLHYQRATPNHLHPRSPHRRYTAVDHLH
mmetsp:Transcript_51496/g.110340  ORF Transcript_51496/g.110340 Transcript_51496/m.110340 type:complete len:203 (-) Transcript_51496:1461-2069(-)